MSVTVGIVDGPLPPSTVAPVGDGVGAALCFEGVVRPDEDQRPICGLTYQVYEPMAVRQLQQLGEQAIRRFSVLAVTVEHSRGFVPKHACSFRLRIASAHRREALQAMDWFIDQLKRDVPIWKLPVFADQPQETVR